MIYKKESAGGFDTTTADTNSTSRIISFRTWIKAALVRLGAMLATFFRGLA